MPTDDFAATCHCGLLQVIAPHKPEEINECQCSICAQYGAAWAYYKTSEVQIIKKDGSNAKAYIWGDKTLSFNFCGACGCVLYWWPLDESEPSKMGINTRNMKRSAVYKVNRKKSFTLCDD